MSGGFDTCSLCPRLCRPVCPVASGSGREAAVPAVIAAALREWEQGRLPPAVAAEASTLCTDCGACQAHCHLHMPLPEAIRAARAALVEPEEVEALRPIEGTGPTIAIEADGRPLAAALAHELGEPVRRWVTGDRLGAALLDVPGAFAPRAEAVRAVVGEVPVIVADGGVARVLGAAGVPFEWLHARVSGIGEGVGSCVVEPGAPVRCCGAAGPLPRHHPDDAIRVARFFARDVDGAVLDGRCRAHLRAAGIDVADPLDRLLALQAAR